MALLFKRILFIFRSLVIIHLFVSKGQALCPDSLPVECSCEPPLRYTVCNGPPENESHWDIKLTFDTISDAVDDGSVMFNSLTISGRSMTSEQPIDPGVITRLKFTNLEINGNQKFSSIHPDAFPGLYDHVRNIGFIGHDFQSTFQAFEFFNKFQKVGQIAFGPDVKLREIPERAFHLPATLDTIYFRNSTIGRIQRFAFGGLENLKVISFVHNNLTDENISSSAFDDIGPPFTQIQLVEPQLTHLAEDKFKVFLDNSGSLVIGFGKMYPQLLMHCDERVDWICNPEKYKMYKEKLFGYYCREPNYYDIFEYCFLRDEGGGASNNNTNNNKQLIAIISILSVLFVAIILILSSSVFKQRDNKKKLRKLENEFRKSGAFSEAPNDFQEYDWLPTLPYVEDYEIRVENITRDAFLGKGNFGTVRSGLLKTVEENGGKYLIPVAIKGLSGEQQTIENLKPLCNELRVMMTMKHTLEPHPNIVGFIGAMTRSFSKCDISIVMELCENGSLKKYLSSHQQDLICPIHNGLGRMISPEAYNWSFQIANGMLFLTKNKILHIDLAARNVLLTGNNVAKISDFGSSRKLRNEKDYYRSRGEVSFHKNWTALEVLKGGSFTTESDIWSYGVTIWEIFSLGCEPNYEPEIDIQFQLEKGIRLNPPLYGDTETKEIIASCWNLKSDDRPNFTKLTSFFTRKFNEISNFLTSDTQGDLRTENGYIPHRMHF